MRLIRTIKSYLVVLKACSCLGRASRFSRNGRKAEALAIARDGLALLRGPEVERKHPAESSAIVSLTILVEELAPDLKEPGATMPDLVDTLSLIKEMTADPNSKLEAYKAWIPYLETRISNASGTQI